MCIPCPGPWDVLLDSPEDEDRRQCSGSNCEKCPVVRNEILPDDLNCYELKTLPVITEKFKHICEHLRLHQSTARILLAQRSRIPVSCFQLCHPPQAAMGISVVPESLIQKDFSDDSAFSVAQ